MKKVKEQIPILKGFLTTDGKRLKVWCPFCKEYYTHGASEKIREGKKSHRIEHCFGENKKHFPSGYFVQLETRKRFY